MMTPLQSRRPSRFNDHELIASLQEILDRKHGEFLNSACKHWEKHFAGKDPSDSCVRVRISGWPRLGGHLA